MDSATGYRWIRREDQPGYDWKNTKAKEDEARALEQMSEKENQIKRKLGICADSRWGERD